MIFSFLFFCIYLLFLIWKIIRAIARKDITFYDTYAYKDIPSIDLTNEEFYSGFSMGGIVDETLYNAKAQYIRRVKNSDGTNNYTITDLELETCKLAKFGTKYRHFFENMTLYNLYCLNKVNLTLEGYTYLDRFSYINLQIYPSINQTKDGKPCRDYNEIMHFFEKNQLDFKIQDNILTPEIYKNPVEPMTKDIPCPVFLRMYQQIYSYFQIVYVETYDDITGLNILAEPKVEKYIKYSDSFIISAPGTADILKTGEPVCDLTMQLAATVLTQRRTYPSIIDVLGEVGGFMEIINAIFKIITSKIVDKLYKISLVNNLFNFDIKKKVIFINKNGYKNSESKKESDIMDRDITKTTQVAIEYDKGINSPNIIANINNIDINGGNKIIENYYGEISSGKHPVPKTENEDIFLQKKIKGIISRCCICICCDKKKRKLRNFLLGEGKKLISEKLDIKNLFIDSAINEKNLEHLSEEILSFEMSKKFKKFIGENKNIINNILDI